MFSFVEILTHVVFNSMDCPYTLETGCVDSGCGELVKMELLHCPFRVCNVLFAAFNPRSKTCETSSFVPSWRSELPLRRILCFADLMGLKDPQSRAVWPTNVAPVDVWRC